MKGIGVRPGKAAALALSGIVAAAMFASTATAKKSSGAAPHGKEIVQLECEGLGTVTVSVPRGEKNNGAGQIVGAKGHGIPVSFATTITDVTKGSVLFTESHQVGHGHAHRNQPTTKCTGSFEASAAQFFEGAEGLPPGVEPTDLIRGNFEVRVIIKK